MEITTKNYRLKRKLDKNTTYNDLLEGWTQCQFLIQHKQRLCNVSRAPGSLFCGTHRPYEGTF